MIRFLVGLVGVSSRHARLVLVLVLALAILSGIHTVETLDVNTDTAKLLSPDLEWQKQGALFDQAFPHTALNTTIVLDGTDPDAVEDGTAALYAALRKRMDLFTSVRRPDGGAFFNQYGLMFLEPPELSALTDQIIEAQPLLGPLDADPSLHGLFGVLDQALGGLEEGEDTADKLKGPLTLFAGSMESVAEAQQKGGTPKSVSWSGLMTGKPPRPEELRHFILVQPKLDPSSFSPGAAASEAIRATARDLHLAERGVRVRLTGEVPLQDDELASVSEGALYSTLGSFSLVLVILLAGLRAPRLILAIAVTLVTGLVLTAGFATVAVGTLNLISVAFAVLFIGLGVDFSIQFAMRYRADLFEVTGGRVPTDPSAVNETALARTARAIVGPLGIAALATAVGFLSFLPTDYKGVSELGLIAGAGMVIALLMNLTLLPALLTVMPGRGAPEPAGFAWAAPIDRWLARHARLVLAGAGGLAVGALILLPSVRFDSDPLDLKDPRKESLITALELIRDPLGSPYSIEILAPDLAAANALAARIAPMKTVRMALTLSSFIPEDQAKKREILDELAQLLGPILVPDHAVAPIDPVAERAALVRYRDHLGRFLMGPKATPIKAEAAKMLAALDRFLAVPNGDVTLLRTALLGGFAGRIDLLKAAVTAPPVDVEGMPASIKADWIAEDGRARVSVFPKEDMRETAAMARFVAELRTITPKLTGAPLSILESGITVANAFLTATGLAMIGITLVLAAVLRRVRHVLLVLIPLVLAGLYVLGALVLLGIPFNFANVIAVPLLLGIGVAFDIYFVIAWRDSTGPVALLQTATARAVVFSAATTSMAFSSLALSAHIGTASMGQLLVLALGFVLASTLIIQPALMSVVGRGR